MINYYNIPYILDLKWRNINKRIFLFLFLIILYLKDATVENVTEINIYIYLNK